MNVDMRELIHYAFLWENFNQVESIEEFKRIIDEKLIMCGIEEEIFFIAAASKFFNVHNIFLENPENGILSKFRITDKIDNCFTTLLGRDIRRKRNFVINKESRQYISGESYKYLFDELKPLNLKGTIEKEVIEGAIRRAFKLTEHHQIEFGDDEIVINVVSLKSSQEMDLEYIFEKDGEKLYNDLAKEIANSLLRDELNLTRVDNIFFHKNYQELIMKYIQDEIRKFYTSSESLFTPFCEYIYERYIDTILNQFVEKIFILIVAKDSNVAKFVNFYNGSQTIIDGATVEKPKIITEDGEEWSYNKILTMLQKRQKFIEDNKLESAERSDFLLERMRTSLKDLQKKREEFPEDARDTKEYQELLFDIDITEKDVLNRESRSQKEKEENNETKEEYDKLTQQKDNLKKAMVNTIKGFYI